MGLDPLRPPEGWFVFGHHADAKPPVPIEFSQEMGEDGFPLWERPASPEYIQRHMTSEHLVVDDDLLWEVYRKGFVNGIINNELDKMNLPEDLPNEDGTAILAKLLPDAYELWEEYEKTPGLRGQILRSIRGLGLGLGPEAGEFNVHFGDEDEGDTRED